MEKGCLVIDKKKGLLLYCNFFLTHYFQAVLNDEYKGFW